MKHQVLFSLKNNEKVLIHVVCCSRDWRFKGKKCVNLLYWNIFLYKTHPDVTYFKEFLTFSCVDKC